MKYRTILDLATILSPLSGRRSTNGLNDDTLASHETLLRREQWTSNIIGRFRKLRYI